VRLGGYATTMSLGDALHDRQAQAGTAPTSVGLPRCPACDISFRYTELAADILGGSRTNMCPRCRRELTEAVRAHLFRCAMLPSEIRLRATFPQELDPIARL
jgi:uncharacterized paraquat-inducible protein A